MNRPALLVAVLAGALLVPANAVGHELIERAVAGPYDRPDVARPSGCPRQASGMRSQTIGRPRFAPSILGLQGTAAGAAMALWPSPGALEYASRRPGGSFGAVRRLRSRPVPFDAWTASDGAGQLVAAWLGSAVRGAVVQATAGSVTGRLAAPQTLGLDPDHGNLLGIPMVAMAPDGSAVAVWTQAASTPIGEGSVFASFRAPDADRFGAPVRASTGPSNWRLLAVAIAPGGRALVALGGYGGQSPAAMEGSAAGLGPATALGLAPTTATAAAAAMNANGAASLAVAAGGAITVLSRPAGGAFGPAVKVSTDGVRASRTLAFATRAGHVALAWSEGDVRVASGRPMFAEGNVGAPLGEARALPLRRGQISAMDLALGAGGSAGLVWVQRCDGDRVLEAGRHTGVERFGAARVVSGRDRIAQAPAIVLGPGARPTIAWVARSHVRAQSVRAATPAG